MPLPYPVATGPPRCTPVTGVRATSLECNVRIPLKSGLGGDEVLDMSDLSNLLGDVYGERSAADAAPVRHEPAAADRSDLIAGLNAAFPAPVPAPAPLPMVDLTAVEAPMPSWTSTPVAAPSVSVSAPVPAMAGGTFWTPGDDDIFPSGKGSRKK
ncbi:MAG TPA: hypothetical protein VM143_11000 [Acidimicrobiales bacterium]|nr:hypothetical protein [Acidimicrobiales bacterium]